MPQLRRVELTAFSLYTQRRRIVADVGSGVFCLAGANGLGKSTFLSAVGFGLTGTVPPERPSFHSLQHYYAKCVSYSREYFDGRITQQDRMAAEVGLEFRVGARFYSIKRNPFEPESIRFLEIRDEAGDVGLPHNEAESDEHRHEVYRTVLTQDIGLNSFPQFVFLQHFLLTFDERRQTLFWDEDNAEKVLYLALGVDPDLAERADEFRKKADAEDSLARNAQYHATSARKQLREITSTTRSLTPDEEAVDKRLQEAQEAHATSSDDLENATDRLSDARLSLAAASAVELRARDGYEQVFSSGLRPRESPLSHPLILEAIRSHSCPVCSSSSGLVAQRIQQSLDSSRCPLCQSETTGEQDSAEFQLRAAALQEADKRLNIAREELQHARERVERIENELAQIQTRFEATGVAQRELERMSPGSSLSRIAETRAGLEEIEQRFQATIDDAIVRKEKHRKRRDEALAGLKPLKKILLEAFADAELKLVPLFQELAMQFLGLPLDVTVSPAGSEKVRLLLTVKSERRRNDKQLSESQRYFLDIALRMALAIHLSAEDSPAPLYIDTPEGSLDIAYESRAGSMFAAFARLGHPLVMTANINTSQLLLCLAEECGTDGMTLARMTDWTNLSDVQSAEEHRIEDAFHAIEAALESGAATPEVVELVGRAHE